MAVLADLAASPAEGHPAGLSAARAASQLAIYGPNTLPAGHPISVWRRVGAQLRDPLVMVLLVAAALTLATGDLTDAAVIGFVVVINTTVGVVQEVRAEGAVAALSRMSAPLARVLRDGHEQTLPAVDLVPDDIIILAEGDVIPADGIVVESPLLLVDESALTGESVPVDRAVPVDTAVPVSRVGPVDPAVPVEPSAPVEPLSAGTVVLRGRAVVRVTATGPASAIGRVASLLDTGMQVTPLQHRLAELGRALAAVATLLCLVVLALGLARGQPTELMLVAAITLAVAAVPESLPAVVTLSLALGARRMAARHAVARRLSAVETLGSVTVLGTDKTGTLTEGRMVAEEVWMPGGTVTFAGTGYRPVGEILVDGLPPGPDGSAAVGQLRDLLTVAVLCNDADLRPPAPGDGDPRDGDPRDGDLGDGDLGEGDPGAWTALGDPTEAALLTAGGKIGLEHRALGRSRPRLAEIPFDSARKRMTTVHGMPGGRVQVCSKGALEALVSEGVLADGPALLERATTEAADLAGRGYRVLAIAGRDLPAVPAVLADAECGLHLLGLVAIADPPKASAAATVTACLRAGITPVMITGDHPATALAIARRLGIVPPGPSGIDLVLTGAAIRAGDIEDITTSRVYARVSPEQKLEIIEAWQACGAVVAMTGDGVNDGPALNRADIGVAMGGRGTEVARQAADLVIVDDDLATVISAVEEGRRVYGNVRRFLGYGLSGGAAEILVMLIGPFIGLAFPLLPAQILWVNLVTHGLTGVALGAEPADPGTMDQPPRPPGQNILGGGLWQRVLRLSAVVGGLSLAVAVWAHHSDRPWQSMLFLALTAAQLGIAVGSRARPFGRDNPSLPVAVAASVLLTLAGIYVPFMRDLLGTVTLTAPDVAIAMACGVVAFAAMRAEVRLVSRSPSAQPVPVG